MDVAKSNYFKALDELGKWPTQTWLQKRTAMLKLEEAREALMLAEPKELLADTEGEDSGDN